MQINLLNTVECGPSLVYMLQFLLNNFKLMAKNVQKRNKLKSAILNFYQMCVSESDGSCLCEACKFMQHITCVNLFMKHIIFVFPCNMYTCNYR